MANISTVQKLSNGQYVVTIPRGVAEALRLKRGAMLSWEIEKGELLVKVL